VNKFYFIVLAVLLSACGATQKRVTDETLNKLVECTGGAIDSKNIEANINAEVLKARKSIDAKAGINYEEVIKGAIFSDKTISEDLKKFYFKEYQKCLDKVRGDPKSIQGEAKTFEILIGVWKGGPVPNLIDDKKKYIIYTFKPDSSLEQKLVYEDGKDVINNCFLCEDKPHISGWGKFTVTDNKLEIIWNLNETKEIAKLTWISPIKFKYQVIEHDDIDRSNDKFYFTKLPDDISKT